ncbi:efflux RND transporter permease subunit [Qipengyuania sphaerica]|uniref:efflux RND transporter permease subunit n=1 Tax=Qipengyuania sphaerica TaxID=2867243 RepID=UPI001C888315|nr:efflux RND transporter permease subunit [Qipengyuania sphaerica]MBX7541459.1 efflux RND transporter permease subunit [Qipengyuania sphaerica]
MNFRYLSAWSIRNPVVPLVLFVALTLAGMISFLRMEVQNDPDLDFPALIISISQPGAAPTEIDTQITEKVESAIASMEGLETISSTVSEGNSRTFVSFEFGYDVNDLVSEAKSNIDQIRGDLPDGIIEPRVYKVRAGNDSFASYAVISDDMTMEQLSWFVDDTVSKRLLAVPGMASASRGGGVSREIRVILDPARMQSLGVTASQVNSVLRQNNLNAGGGQAEIAGSRQSVRVVGNAETAYELGQRRIALGGGRSIKLADIAEVKDGQSEITTISKVNGQPVVTISLARARGESDVTVYDESQIVMQQIEAEYPGVKFVELFNIVQYTKGQYNSSIEALIEGAILAVVVVFFFLRDWRATFISAVAIPLSAIPTFFVLHYMGYTLNQMSLLALGLVAGVLVDDAIVEIENIVRHMRMGKTAFQASIDAADEIGLAVAATSFSIVAVFLPVALLPGVAGQYFENFGITVVVSVLMSLAVARMITPMLAAYFLKPHGVEDHANGPWIQRYARVLEWTLDRDKAREIKAAKIARKGRIGFFGKLGAHLRGDHRAWVMGAGLLSFILTIILFATTPAQFFPDADFDFADVRMSMVPGTTLEQTEERAEQALAIIDDQPEVENVLASIWEGGASFFITYRDDRERTSAEIERDVSPLLRQVPDARLNFRNMQGDGGGGGSGRAINVMLSGSDPDLLKTTAETLVEQMGGIREVQGARLEADLQRPELIIEPRADLAASLGVTTASLSQAIRIATIGEIDQNAARFSLSDRQIPIRVMLPEESRDRIATIRNLPVPTATGGSVPLERVADIRFGAGPTTIQREDRQRRVFVSADLSPGAAEGVAKQKINELPIMQNLPIGVSNAPSGQDRWLAEFFVDFQIALVAGILLVFAVLVLLYRRLMSPLVNMGSLLLAPLGAILAVQLANIVMPSGMALSLPVFIGILLLFGIVAKNSILLVDFAIEAMDHGKRKYDAIMEAGQKRAQPIVMTTVAMTAGMVPTAMSLSADGAWRQPMGVAVIGGLIVSTFLTLLIVPAGFSLADGIEKRAGPWLRDRLLSYRPGMDDGSIRGRKPGIEPAE